MCVEQVVIPVSNITVLKKQNTALLVPNALSIRSNLGEKVSVNLVYVLQIQGHLSKFRTSLCDKCLEDESFNLQKKPLPYFETISKLVLFQNVE